MFTNLLIALGPSDSTASVQNREPVFGLFLEMLPVYLPSLSSGSFACATMDLTINGETIPADTVQKTYIASLAGIFAKIV